MTTKKIHLTFLIFITLTLLSHQFANADIIPQENWGNRGKECVEYFVQNGKNYCSTTPLSANDGGISTRNYDVMDVKFDGRPWVPAWGKQADNLTVVEYLVNGDDINHWQELVTSQFMPGLNLKTTPMDLSMFIQSNLEKTGHQFAFNYFLQTPNDVIFEYKIAEPSPENEIQRILSTPKGFHVLHYAVKKADMGDAERNKWITLLKQAQPKN